MTNKVVPRVLVVDDDPSILNLYRGVFRWKNLALDTADDGLDAIKKILAGQYNLILLDLMMPHMSGFQVIQWLKANRPESLRCVVVVTALSPDAYRELDRTLIHDLVAKPFDVAELEGYIVDFLAGKGVSWIPEP